MTKWRSSPTLRGSTRRARAPAHWGRPNGHDGRASANAVQAGPAPTGGPPRGGRLPSRAPWGQGADSGSAIPSRSCSKVSWRQAFCVRHRPDDLGVGRVVCVLLERAYADAVDRAQPALGEPCRSILLPDPTAPVVVDGSALGIGRTMPSTSASRRGPPIGMTAVTDASTAAARDRTDVRRRVRAATTDRGHGRGIVPVRYRDDPRGCRVTTRGPRVERATRRAHPRAARDVAAVGRAHALRPVGPRVPLRDTFENDVGGRRPPLRRPLWSMVYAARRRPPSLDGDPGVDYRPVPGTVLQQYVDAGRSRRSRATLDLFAR